MKTAIFALAIALLIVGSLLFALTVRWIRLVLESYQRHARQSHCGFVQINPPVAGDVAERASNSAGESLPK